MTAPERILAWQNAEGQGIYAQHSDGFERDFSETHFTRTDIHQAALDRIADLERAVRDVIGMLDDPTGGEHVRDMRGATVIARAVLAKGDG